MAGIRPPPQTSHTLWRGSLELGLQNCYISLCDQSSIIGSHTSPCGQKNKKKQLNRTAKRHIDGDDGQSSLPIGMSLMIPYDKHWFWLKTAQAGFCDLHLLFVLIFQGLLGGPQGLWSGKWGKHAGQNSVGANRAKCLIKVLLLPKKIKDDKPFVEGPDRLFGQVLHLVLGGVWIMTS